MRIKTTLIAFCLTLSLSASAGDLLSSTGITAGVMISNLVLNKVNPNPVNPLEVSAHLGSLASIGVTAVVSIFIADGIAFLSSNTKTQRLEQVLGELRENDELKDKTDEELTMMIVSLSEDME